VSFLKTGSFSRPSMIIKNHMDTTTQQPPVNSTEMNSIVASWELPTPSPTRFPTLPTPAPSTYPSMSPTPAPSSIPTTAEPTDTPTHIPTSVPTFVPTPIPTFAPSVAPTKVPTALPTFPTLSPTHSPTRAPTAGPTNTPTAKPTVFDETTYIKEHSRHPTAVPTTVPSAAPSHSPTAFPTSLPTFTPAPTTRTPTRFPTAFPTESLWEVLPAGVKKVNEKRLFASVSRIESNVLRNDAQHLEFNLGALKIALRFMKMNREEVASTIGKYPIGALARALHIIQAAEAVGAFRTVHPPVLQVLAEVRGALPGLLPTRSPTSVPTSMSPTLAPTSLPTKLDQHKMQWMNYLQTADANTADGATTPTRRPTTSAWARHLTAEPTRQPTNRWRTQDQLKSEAHRRKAGWEIRHAPTKKPATAAFARHLKKMVDLSASYKEASKMHGKGGTFLDPLLRSKVHYVGGGG
jgi:hypothetical protein